MEILHMLYFLSFSLNSCIALEVDKGVKMVKLNFSSSLSQCSISIPHIPSLCISGELGVCGSWEEGKD